MNRKVLYIWKYLLPAMVILLTTWFLVQVAIDSVHEENRNKLGLIAQILENEIRNSEEAKAAFRAKDSAKLEALLQPLLDAKILVQDGILGASVYLPDQQRNVAFSPRSAMSGNLQNKISISKEAVQAYQSGQPGYYSIQNETRIQPIYNYINVLEVDGQKVALISVNQTVASMEGETRTIWLYGIIISVLSLLVLIAAAVSEYRRERTLMRELANVTQWLKGLTWSYVSASDVDRQLTLLKKLPTEFQKAIRFVDYARLQKRHVLEHLPLGIMILDTNAKITYANPSLRRLLGRTHEELHAMSAEEWRCCYQLSDGSYVSDLLERGEPVENCLGVIRHSTGKEIPFTLTMRSLPDDDGKAMGYFLYVRDLSEEIALDRQEQKIHYLFNAIPMCVLLINEQKQIEYINPSVSRLFSCTEHDLLGKALFEALPWQLEESARLFYEPLHKALSTGMRMHSSDIQALIHGREYDLDCDFFPILNAYSSTADGCMILIKDKTLYREWEDLSQRVAQHTNYVQMAATIAHEVRNPMTSVRGFLQLLSSQINGDTHRKYLDVMTTEIDRMNTILSEYLSMARTPQPEWEPIHLTELVNDTFLLLEGEANYRGVNLSLELAADCRIHGIARELKQVLINLVRNAFDALEDGEGLIELRLQAAEPNDYLVTVTDNGVGIAPEQLARIFEPFFTTKAMGTGLGLPVCKKIIESHGGSLRVQSEPGAGTTFTIQLPKSFD
ncbi:PAS domain S-box-containing protein [Tumebacillus sp. BK434]|uniref:ATP-binding protein n=1 Tax=Tumebacillus sp. BK434 TaxID=2512169 RepID=UPI00104DFE53|nr:ATP-binding protein [Tumebacillus sp. BK434]TCP55994.1 PAS domain S-box-containing protein [Tumebacillus sp. BK434]